MSTVPTKAYDCPACGGPVFCGLVHQCPSTTVVPFAAKPLFSEQDAAKRRAILAELAVERERQEELFPGQELPDGTGPGYRPWANMAKAACEFAARTGELTWAHVLEEEFAEALAEDGLLGLRGELVQVAAVAVRWIEAIDRRRLRFAEESYAS